MPLARSNTRTTGTPLDIASKAICVPSGDQSSRSVSGHAEGVAGGEQSTSTRSVPAPMGTSTSRENGDAITTAIHPPPGAARAKALNTAPDGVRSR